MSDELKRLQACLDHDDAYFEDNKAIMAALALILKRHECFHNYEYSHAYKAWRFYVCKVCEQFLTLRAK